MSFMIFPGKPNLEDLLILNCMMKDKKLEIKRTETISHQSQEDSKQ